MLAMTNSKLNIIFVLSSLCLTLVIAIPSPSIDSRQTVNQTSQCRNAPAIFNETCWETLNMTTWLTDWILPECDSSNATDCCRPSEDWSNCFLRWATGVDLFNCTQFNTGSCAQTPTTISNSVDKRIVPEVWYVVKNIFGMLDL